MNLFLNWFKIKHKSKIRSVIRGYDTLNYENRVEFISQLKNQIADKPLNGKTIDENHHSNLMTCYHQFLIYRLININLNRALLSAIGTPSKKVYYPLPKLWRQILVDNGFNIPFFWNQILWIKFNLKWYLIGLMTGILEILNFEIYTRDFNNKNSVYFDNLYPNNFAQNNNKFSLNILEWFCNQKESENIRIIYHSCKTHFTFKRENKKIILLRNAIPKIQSFYKLINFIFWLIQKSISALFFSTDRILFRELVFEKIVQLSKKEHLSKIYLFHNSVHVFRPLWTYEAEQKGSEIIFYFYSTNVSSFKVKEKPHSQDNQWQVVNWPHYWVWNKGQIKFLRSNVLSKFKTTIKGIIPFSNSIHEFNYGNLKEKKIILVFDVQPQNKYHFCSIAQNVYYYSVEDSVKFLTEVHKISKIHNFLILLKRKREQKLYASKKYYSLINKLRKSGDLVEINSEINALEVVSNTRPIACISMPFTSAAFVAFKKDIPSIFFDPSNTLDKDYYKDQKPPLISSNSELYKWFEDLMLINTKYMRKY